MLHIANTHLLGTVCCAVGLADAEVLIDGRLETPRLQVAVVTWLLKWVDTAWILQKSESMEEVVLLGLESHAL